MGVFSFLKGGGKKGNKTLTLNEATKLLDELRLSLLNITPVNLEEERKKFFKSDTYNPQFEYREIKNKNDEIFDLLKKVEEISDVDPRISQFYLDLIQDKQHTWLMMKNAGNNEVFTEYAKQKYNETSPIIFRNACRILRGKVDSYDLADPKKLKENIYLEYKSIVDVFKTAFEMLGLNEWEAVKSQKIGRQGVKTGTKAKKVYVDKKIKKHPFSLRKTLVHEIGTHVLRSVNGEKSGYPALSKPNLESYLDVEEGLAVYNEELMGVLKESDLRKRAMYVWAIGIGEELSFRKLYDAVHALTTKTNAFDVTYRVKRGLGDTSLPGIYSKDGCYFRGFRRVRRRLRKDPYMYRLLYAGKINFKQIQWVEDGLISDPAIVPSKEKFLKIFKECSI